MLYKSAVVFNGEAWIKIRSSKENITGGYTCQTCIIFSKAFLILNSRSYNTPSRHIVVW